MSATSSTVIHSPSASFLMSSTHSKKSSEISKVYKEATALYLTRQLREALATIQPILGVAESDQTSGNDGSLHRTAAPIASTSRKLRVKVWCFYSTLLNAIAELEPEEGREAFGAKSWNSLTEKICDGSVWNEVVDIGYGGVESNLDIEVVNNLANLLLAQSPSQKINQGHIEYFLSAQNPPALDLPQGSSAQAVDSLRDLESRTQLIEIYALHVLPKNKEWDYAKNFVQSSDILDDESRDAFLQTLKELEDEEYGRVPLQHLDPVHEPENRLEPQLQDSITSDSASTVREAPLMNHHRSNSEIDYGIEEKKIVPGSVPEKKPSPPRPIRKISSNQRHHCAVSRSTTNTLPQRPTSGPIKQSLVAFGALQQLFSHVSRYFTHNPLVLLRFILFLVSLVTALSRRDVRERLRIGWDKVKRTIGMGVKVSYI